ncbi:MAG: hypothetical protein CSA79_02685 [Thiothrix nivea]|nr:MAG: hypothetical protein CSA79_02685 [Thiothrix nivea]
MKKLEIITVIAHLLTLSIFFTACTDEKYQETNQTKDEYVIADSFRFASNRRSAIESGVIRSKSNDNKPEKISPEILAAIKKNPGLETGEGFRAPLSLEQTNCQLFGVNIQLSDQPDTRQWLVAPLPPCGKYKYAPLNLPFWLVEQKQGKSPRVLLAYRAHYLITWIKKHENYADIRMTYQSLDGNEMSIDWHYQGNEYVYHSSLCSNLGPVDPDEPAYFTDCAPVKRWSNR